MIEVGHSAEVRRRFTPAELSALGAADRVPEPLLAALISMLLGMYLPGQGTEYPEGLDINDTSAMLRYLIIQSQRTPRVVAALPDEPMLA